ncbi:MAG TPA: MotA/TolQ/ExbB proton channel family protein [Candidatus Binatia bacterium]|nr:MotA/TolQ/ExbB proton channel family protein [Candidatus Binatia bacterium]
MSFSLTEMWQHMGLPAKIVGGFLLAMGLASLTVFIERLLALRRSRTGGRLFAAEAGELLQIGNFEAASAEATKHPHAHLAQLVHGALGAFVAGRESGDALSPIERTRRFVGRRLETLGADMRRGMNVLASVGSVAPFVGLLGTVVGIITAFQGIAASGSGGLSSVSAGISEALIETALGLAVAIPAVLAFNYLSSLIAADELALATSAGELLDTLEGFGDEETRRVRHDRVA